MYWPLIVVLLGLLVNHKAVCGWLIEERAVIEEGDRNAA